MTDGWVVLCLGVSAFGFAVGLAALVTHLDWRMAERSRRRRRARVRDFDATALLRRRLDEIRERA